MHPWIVYFYVKVSIQICSEITVFFFEINAFINASLDYSFLNATSVLYSKHSANIFSLAKNPLKLYTH